jgi:hypothetical protein
LALKIRAGKTIRAYPGQAATNLDWKSYGKNLAKNGNNPPFFQAEPRPQNLKNKQYHGPEMKYPYRHFSCFYTHILLLERSEEDEI